MFKKSTSHSFIYNLETFCTSASILLCFELFFMSIFSIMPFFPYYLFMFFSSFPFCTTLEILCTIVCILFFFHLFLVSLFSIMLFSSPHLVISFLPFPCTGLQKIFLSFIHSKFRNSSYFYVLSSSSRQFSLWFHFLHTIYSCFSYFSHFLVHYYFH